MENVLPVVLQDGNEVFGEKWIFQEDGANQHQHKNSVRITFHH